MSGPLHHHGHHDGHRRPPRVETVTEWAEPEPLYVFEYPERPPVWVYLLGGAIAGLLIATLTRE
jgi:hypothetical protein